MIGFLARMALRIRGNGNASACAVLRGIASPVEFELSLRRERFRSDRSGKSFSLLIYEAPKGRPAADLLAQATRILQQRLDLIDEVGWIDRWRIGVLLPLTPPQRALRIVHELERKFPGIFAALRVRVFSYPAYGPHPDDQRTRPISRSADSSREVEPIEVRLCQPIAAGKSGFDLPATGAEIVLLLALLIPFALFRQGF